MMSNKSVLDKHLCYLQIREVSNLLDNFEIVMIYHLLGRSNKYIDKNSAKIKTFLEKARTNLPLK